MSTDTLLLPRWIIPVVPHGLVLEQHALLISQQRIADLLPAEQARHRYPQAQLIELPEQVLLPGLVNAHTHAAMNLLRGYADDLPLMTWLQEHIWPAEGRLVSPEFVHAGSLLAFAELLRGGVTCCNDMYFFPSATARAAQQAGIRAQLGMIVLEFPSAYAQTAADYLAQGAELRAQLQDHPRLSVNFAPHAPYTVSAENLARVAQLSADWQLPVHIHLHETAAEVAQHQAQHGCRPLETLRQVGLLNQRLCAVHMTQLNAEEIAQLAAAQANVLHCPESNLKLASGFCPTAALSAAGVNLALGTDGAASNNDLDLFGELRIAALLAKAVSGDAAALPAAQALHMATLGGAQALGLAHQIGSLEIGKAADVIAVDLGDLDAQPVFHPISHLVYSTQRHQVQEVWVAGQHLVHQGQFTHLDRQQLKADAQQWAARVRSQ